MHGYRDEMYGDRSAEHYDGLLAHHQPPAEMLVLLESLAGKGAAVEIGVGTGRVAVPLARRGLRITGVDVSAEMISRLTEKCGSLAVTGLVAEATSFTLPEPAELIYCVFNTMYQIQSGEQQAAFLRNVVRNLADDGRLLLETGIFRPADIAGGRGMTVKRLAVEQVILQVYSHDAERQLIEKQEIILEHGKPVQLVPSVQHYVSPEQLVEMAEAAGLTMTARYGTWDKDPFTEESDNAITIFQKKAARVSCGDPGSLEVNR